MNGKINLCGIKIDYSNWIKYFTNYLTNYSSYQNPDDESSIEKELNLEIETYQKWSIVNKTHKDCIYKCIHKEDWLNYSLDDYIIHQQECEERYIKLFDDINFINQNYLSDYWHPRNFLILHDNQINYYASLLGHQNM